MNSARCNELAQSAQAARSFEDVHELCSTLVGELGFDCFLYAAQFPSSLVKPQVIVVSGYPREWREHYVQESYSRVDPTLHHCRDKSTPLVWPGIDTSPKDVNEVVRRFMCDADDFGLRTGASFPVHGGHGEAAVLSLVSQSKGRRAERRVMNALPFAHFVANHVHEAVRRVCEGEGIALDHVELTGRERECLLWAAEGKTAWEISQILAVSQRTVVFHLNNATTKLNATNRQHAVARAVARSLLTPQIISPRIN